MQRCIAGVERPMASGENHPAELLALAMAFCGSDDGICRGVLRHVESEPGDDIPGNDEAGCGWRLVECGRGGGGGGRSLRVSSRRYLLRILRRLGNVILGPYFLLIYFYNYSVLIIPIPIGIYVAQT